jgi:CheY-like chemotaxis protein
MSESGTNDLRSTASNRILVVDDEEIVLSALRDTLRRQNYEVVATTQPATALEELRKNPFAVVIADQRMPFISGLELLDQAKANPARRHAHPHRGGGEPGHRH